MMALLVSFLGFAAVLYRFLMEVRGFAGGGGVIAIH